MSKAIDKLIRGKKYYQKWCEVWLVYAGEDRDQWGWYNFTLDGKVYNQLRENDIESMFDFEKLPNNETLINIEPSLKGKCTINTGNIDMDKVDFFDSTIIDDEVQIINTDGKSDIVIDEINVRVSK